MGGSSGSTRAEGRRARRHDGRYGPHHLVRAPRSPHRARRGAARPAPPRRPLGHRGLLRRGGPVGHRPRHRAGGNDRADDAVRRGDRALWPRLPLPADRDRAFPHRAAEKQCPGRRSAGRARHPRGDRDRVHLRRRRLRPGHGYAAGPAPDPGWPRLLPAFAGQTGLVVERRGHNGAPASPRGDRFTPVGDLAARCRRPPAVCRARPHPAHSRHRVRGPSHCAPDPGRCESDPDPCAPEPPARTSGRRLPGRGRDGAATAAPAPAPRPGGDVGCAGGRGRGIRSGVRDAPRRRRHQSRHDRARRRSGGPRPGPADRGHAGPARGARRVRRCAPGPGRRGLYRRRRELRQRRRRRSHLVREFCSRARLPARRGRCDARPPHDARGRHGRCHPRPPRRRHPDHPRPEGPLRAAARVDQIGVTDPGPPTDHRVRSRPDHLRSRHRHRPIGGHHRRGLRRRLDRRGDVMRSRRPIARGPHLGTILLGIVLLLGGLAALSDQLLSATLDWHRLAPYAVLGTGALLAVAGLGAAIARRRREPGQVS
ncbi:hypothetical protein BN13_170028 [Nostocoides jenkinsii Ben 74]|uniref:Uncharacterized protein n=2 Tax=Nostocoides jenkinsii TaxID=330834 RepID=A0A077MC68_9MICO|nr:hypothetical protein BN13_170028 [Tetrasphaera jenkinsii Ben 74]